MAENKILLVDDDPDILEVNQVLLSNEGYDVDTAENASNAYELVLANSYDCIVLDIMLPDSDGFSVSEEIKKYTDAPIIFLSAKDQLEDKIQGFSAGGDDYMTKPYSLQELSARISAHIRRSEKSKSMTLKFPPLIINLKTRQVTLNENTLHLTNREYDILCYLAETPNTPVSLMDIYSRVWKDGDSFDNHIVMVNISYLRKKLEKAAPEIRLIKTEWGKGYSFAYPPVEADAVVIE